MLETNSLWINESLRFILEDQVLSVLLDSRALFGHDGHD